MIAQDLHAYRNLVEIGHGGMGTIYRATAPNGNLVALKLLSMHLANDPTARLRFEHERDYGLNHPNIVRLQSWGMEKNAPFLVMDYVVGESLDRLIRRKGVLTPKELAPILVDIGSALDYAHKRGVIHRDVKPSNILLRTNGRALLNDFGVAKSEDLGTAFTKTAARIGSVYYMSPEQALGHPHITPASDIYSLGATAYHALTGHPPFEAANDIAIARMHVDSPPLHVSEVNRAVPHNVGDVIMRALSKQPNDRQRSAGEFAAAFSKAAQHGRWRQLARPTHRIQPYLVLLAVFLCALAGFFASIATGALPDLLNSMGKTYLPSNARVTESSMIDTHFTLPPAATPTATATNTPQPTPTATSTSTATATATKKPTATRKATPAATSTRAPTRTPVPPTPDIPPIVTIESRSRQHPPSPPWYPRPDPDITGTPPRPRPRRTATPPPSDPSITSTPSRPGPRRTATLPPSDPPLPDATKPPAKATVTLKPTSTPIESSTPISPSVTLTTSITLP